MTGYAFCGSFCMFSRSVEALRELADGGEDLLPVMSQTAYSTDTRFGGAHEFVEKIEGICKKKVLHTIEQTEPLGPRIPLELLVIAPCTGNTLAKIAHGIADSSVTMAAKAHLRADRPVLLALSTNDAMSRNLQNIGALLNMKNIYFVPMLQDDPAKKPHSLVADYSKLKEAISAAKCGVQLRPLFLS